MDVVMVGGLSETKEYASELSWPFRAARWKVTFWIAHPGVVERGVSLFFFAGNDPLTRQATFDLGAAFSFAGIPCKAEIAAFTEMRAPGEMLGPINTGHRIAQIRMYVGEKP
jgi:hypothetical protein